MNLRLNQLIKEKEMEALNYCLDEEDVQEDYVEDSCKICLDTLNNSIFEKIRLPCSHEFHVMCLKKSLHGALAKSSLRTCPYCRTMIAPGIFKTCIMKTTKYSIDPSYELKNVSDWSSEVEIGERFYIHSGKYSGRTGVLDRMTPCKIVLVECSHEPGSKVTVSKNNVCMVVKNV
jgi:hypothetical protein